VDTGGFELHNRKYLGSKHRLLDFIGPVILAECGAKGVFIDGFAGTGVVGHYFRRHADRIIANDLLYCNYIVNKVFLNSTRGEVSRSRVAALLAELAALPPERGYAFTHYGGSYFTPDNAGRIDAVREGIAEMRRRGRCSRQEEYVLLASLLFAMDKSANTVGQYDAFLKHIGRAAYSAEGKHVVDSNVYKPLTLRLPRFEFDGRNRVYNQDLNDLIARIEGDVLYLDPPYNTRQYVDCYHVLENVMRWDKPALYGKTRKFQRERFKSRYSRRGQAAAALAELVGRARVDHIFLSYNDEGIIGDPELWQILGRRGRVRLFEQGYPVFGGGAGVTRKRNITERLFYCRCGH
jgi:adenine-specific DNA-methyltransferase